MFETPFFLKNKHQWYVCVYACKYACMYVWYHICKEDFLLKFAFWWCMCVYVELTDYAKRNGRVWKTAEISRLQKYHEYMNYEYICMYFRVILPAFVEE